LVELRGWFDPNFVDSKCFQFQKDHSGLFHVIFKNPDKIFTTLEKILQLKTTKNIIGLHHVTPCGTGAMQGNSISNSHVTPCGTGGIAAMQGNSISNSHVTPCGTGV